MLRTCADPQPSDMASPKRLCSLVEGLRLSQDRTTRLEKLEPSRGQAHPPADAVKKQNAVGAFECLDLPRRRRLTQPQPVLRLAEATRVGSKHKSS